MNTFLYTDNLDYIDKNSIENIEENVLYFYTLKDTYKSIIIEDGNTHMLSGNISKLKMKSIFKNGEIQEEVVDENDFITLKRISSIKRTYANTVSFFLYKYLQAISKKMSIVLSLLSSESFAEDFINYKYSNYEINMINEFNLVIRKNDTSIENIINLVKIRIIIHYGEEKNILIRKLLKINFKQL